MDAAWVKREPNTPSWFYSNEWDRKWFIRPIPKLFSKSYRWVPTTQVRCEISFQCGSHLYAYYYYVLRDIIQKNVPDLVEYVFICTMAKWRDASMPVVKYLRKGGMSYPKSSRRSLWFKRCYLSAKMSGALIWGLIWARTRMGALVKIDFSYL